MCLPYYVTITRYKYYERWATANDFPVENVINDGSTTLEDRLGAVADLELAIRSRKLQDDIVVVWQIYQLLMLLSYISLVVWHGLFYTTRRSFLYKQIAGDMLCADQNFDIAQVIRFFRSQVSLEEYKCAPRTNGISFLLKDGGVIVEVKSWACNQLFVSVLQPGELIIYYELEESEKSTSRGIVEVCPDTHKWEKITFFWSQQQH